MSGLPPPNLSLPVGNTIYQILATCNAIRRTEEFALQRFPAATTEQPWRVQMTPNDNGLIPAFQRPPLAGPEPGDVHSPRCVRPAGSRSPSIPRHLMIGKLTAACQSTARLPPDGCPSPRFDHRVRVAPADWVGLPRRFQHVPVLQARPSSPPGDSAARRDCPTFRCERPPCTPASAGGLGRNIVAFRRRPTSSCKRPARCGR